MDIKQLQRELTALKRDYKKIATLPVAERRSYGQKLNQQKQALEAQITELESKRQDETVKPLDVTAPMGINEPKPMSIASDNGSRHPLMVELDHFRSIAERIGFNVVESNQLVGDFHMFDSLNFPSGHPARDSYDTFRTEEGFVPPAHTTAMQNSILREGKEELEQGGQIATVTLGRTFRNEDVDATHEHTFYQWDGVFVSRDATLGQLIAVLREFFQEFYGQKLEIRTQPAYFPFTEPSLEILVEKPASIGGKKGDWLEMLGGGMIHPDVLEMAGIDPKKYKGFAWGGGLDRLVMLKYGIDDVRHFESGKLRFLKELK